MMRKNVEVGRLSAGSLLVGLCVFVLSSACEKETAKHAASLAAPSFRQKAVREGFDCIELFKRYRGFPVDRHSGDWVGSSAWQEAQCIGTEKIGSGRVFFMEATTSKMAEYSFDYKDGDVSNVRRLRELTPETMSYEYVLSLVAMYEPELRKNPDCWFPDSELYEHLKQASERVCFEISDNKFACSVRRDFPETEEDRAAWTQIIFVLEKNVPRPWFKDGNPFACDTNRDVMGKG